MPTEEQNQHQTPANGATKKDSLPSSSQGPVSHTSAENLRFKQTGYSYDSTVELTPCMSRDEVNHAYNGGLAIPDTREVLAYCQARSKLVYQNYPHQKNLAYGTKPRQKYDFFPCGKKSVPTLIFIHGGGWTSCTKEDFALIATGPLNQGFNLILAEYTLAPEATIAQMVAEMGKLIDHIDMDRDQLGIKGNPIIVAGHSAGGHLAATQRAHPKVQYCMIQSGLLDLAPYTNSWVTDALNLSPADIQQYSPVNTVTNGAPTLVLAGALELPGILTFAARYTYLLQQKKQQVVQQNIPGLTHFLLTYDLSNPYGTSMALLLDLLSKHDRAQ